MSDLPLKAITPERAMQISRGAVELLNKLLVTKSPAKAQQIAQEFVQQIPELAAVAELRQAFAIGLAQAAADSTKPLTPKELAELLDRSGLSQSQLAALLGVAQPMVSLWLNETRPIPQARAQAIRQACMTAFANQVLATGMAVFDSPAGQAASRRKRP